MLHQLGDLLLTQTAEINIRERRSKRRFELWVVFARHSINSPGWSYGHDTIRILEWMKNNPLTKGLSPIDDTSNFF
jgi:hypothetical protein